MNNISEVPIELIRKHPRVIENHLENADENWLRDYLTIEIQSGDFFKDLNQNPPQLIIGISKLFNQR